MPITKEERLWRLLSTLFRDDQQLRRFIAMGPESREIAAFLPGAGASVIDLSWKAVELLAARGGIPPLLTHLASWHPDCSHSAAIAEVQRCWDLTQDPGISRDLERQISRLRLPPGADLDILPYIKGWSVLRAANAQLTLRLSESTLEIEAFPCLLRKGVVVQGTVSYRVDEPSLGEDLVAATCEHRRRSTYSYYPLGRGREPVFDLTLGDQALLLDSPEASKTDDSVQTLVIEYDL